MNSNIVLLGLLYLLYAEGYINLTQVLLLLALSIHGMFLSEYKQHKRLLQHDEFHDVISNNNNNKIIIFRTYFKSEEAPLCRFERFY